MMVYDIPGRVIIVPGLWGKVEYISENYWEHFSEASDGQRCFQENAKECCSEYKEK